MLRLQTPLIAILAIFNSSNLVVAKPQDHCNSLAAYPIEFSSSFQQPAPPNVNNEYKTHWIQHKWNANLSHITAGFLYNSPAAGKVRVDQAFEMSIASAIFDYTNISSDGLVSNILYSYSPSIASKPTIFSDYVNSNFPLFTEDILKSNGAVFTGLTSRDKIGKVSSWSIMYQNIIPVTVFLDGCNIIVGYDYFSPDLRTRVLTEYFNIQVGPVAEDVFMLPS